MGESVAQGFWGGFRRISGGGGVCWIALIDPSIHRTKSCGGKRCGARKGKERVYGLVWDTLCTLD